MEAIKKFLSRNKENRVRVAVVGDTMIDEYYYVTANRVSPEFPIPVMLSANHGTPTFVVPGGAGNVCSQFKHFNASVNFFGFIDGYAERILGMAHTGFCVMLPDGLNVPLKRRFYHGQFPLCRWDIERRNYGWGDNQQGFIRLEEHQRLLHDKFLRTKKADVVILSDYDKGVFAGYGKKRWVSDEYITIVDPKRGPLEDWEGCTIFKPNNKEAKELSGCSHWKEQSKFFVQKLGCKAVLITQGAEGVTGMIGKEFFEYHPAQQTVADSVIGAGDCFVAFLAMSLAQKMEIEEAVQVAFEAGAIYVQKKHNQPVYLEELLRLADPIEAKFQKPGVKNDGLTVSPARSYSLAFTNGCYDIMHEGHVKLLQHAKSLADKLVVAVNSDESVRRQNKGDNRPIIPLEQRMRMIAALECVDFVISFEEDTPYNLIKELRPEVLVKGADWTGNIVGSDLVDNVVAFPIIPGLSTTKIIERIKSNESITNASPGTGCGTGEENDEAG